jgi:hypothetical protein
MSALLNRHCTKTGHNWFLYRVGSHWWNLRFYCGDITKPGTTGAR